MGGTVSGKITDENGDPMPGATIYVLESGMGTASNLEGEYFLELSPGSYTIIFRFIGYKTFSQRVTLTNEQVTLDVQLKPQAIILNEVLIRAGAEDPAYTIMRKAIAKAPYYRNIVDEHTSRVYMKGTGNLNKIPFFLRKRLKEEGIDTSRTFIAESVSEIKFRRPAHYEEKVISIRSNGDDNNTSPNSYITASFYEPEIVETISPLNPRAFSHYKFEYLGSYTDQGHEINRVKVIARTTGDHLFNGEISIVEDDWSIHSLKLDAVKLGIGIHVEQLYREFENLAWLPVTHNFKVGGKILGVGFGYKYLASVNYSEVKINRELSPEVVVVDEKIEKDRVNQLKALESAITEIPETEKEAPELSRKELRKQMKEYEKEELKESEEPDILLTSAFGIDSLAYKRGKDYWSEVRPVPLTKKEIIGYRQVDSIAGNLEKDTTKEARRKRGFKIYHILTGGYYRMDKKNTAFIKEPVSGIGFNTVEGLFIDYSLGYRRQSNLNADNPNITTTRRRFEFDSHLRYSLARNRLLPHFSTEYSRRKGVKSSTISFRGGSTIYQYNDQAPIHPTLNALYTLFMEQNFMKLYQADEYLLEFQQDLSGKWRAGFQLGYQYRRNLRNNSDFSMINWNNRTYTENDPSNEFLADTSFPDHNHTFIEGSLRVRPWLKYRMRNGRRIPMRNTSPTVTFRLRKALPGLFNGQTDYLRQSTVIEYDWDLNPLGTLNIVGSYQSFLNKERVYFMDFNHYNGNQTIFSPGNEYRQLNYYQLSNSRYSFGLNTNFKFQSNKFLARLPFLAKKGVRDFAVFNALYVPGSTYLEAGYGLDYLFRFMRVEAVASFLDGNFQGVGIRVGLPPDIIFN